MTKVKPNELYVNPLPLDKFVWDGRHSILSAFESDFGPLREMFDPRTGRKWLQQLYNDACDIGIAIRSHKTGNVERFYLIQEEKDPEGDLIARHFKPLNEACRVVRVVIYND